MGNRVIFAVLVSVFLSLNFVLSAPAISILEPVDMLYTNRTISLVLDAPGNESIWFTNASGQNETYLGPTTLNFTHDGMMTIYAFANDSLGINSTQVTFEVRTGEPVDIYGCGLLQYPNTTYRLMNNIRSNGTCFFVTASQITIDGNGFSITGNGTGYGIAVHAFDYVNVTGFGGIVNYSIGVEINLSRGSRVINNNISSIVPVFGKGVSIRNSSAINVSGNNITINSSVQAVGVNYFYSDNSTFADNSIAVWGTAYGFYVVGSHRNSFNENRIRFFGTSSIGFYFYYSDHNNMTSSNVASTSRLDGNEGVRFTLSFNNRASFNSITGVWVAIRTNQVVNTTIDHNNLSCIYNWDSPSGTSYVIQSRDSINGLYDSNNISSRQSGYVFTGTWVGNQMERYINWNNYSLYHNTVSNNYIDMNLSGSSLAGIYTEAPSYPYPLNITNNTILLEGSTTAIAVQSFNVIRGNTILLKNDSFRRAIGIEALGNNNTIDQNYIDIDAEGRGITTMYSNNSIRYNTILLENSGYKGAGDTYYSWGIKVRSPYTELINSVWVNRSASNVQVVGNNITFSNPRNLTTSSPSGYPGFLLYPTDRFIHLQCWLQNGLVANNSFFNPDNVSGPYEIYADGMMKNLTLEDMDSVGPYMFPLEYNWYGWIFPSQGSNMTFRKTQSGEVAFMNFACNGTRLSDDLAIGERWIYLNQSKPCFNRSASLKISFPNYVAVDVFKDGVACPAEMCVVGGFNGTEISFDVTQAGNYSVSERMIVEEPEDSGGSRGGGGGGGGGSSMTPHEKGKEEVKIISHVPGNQPQKIEFVSVDMGITEVEFTLSAPAHAATIRIRLLDGPPAKETGEIEGIVYKYMSITKTGLDDKNVKDGKLKLKFRVEVAWLKENGLDPSSVKLRRYVDGVWTDLVTTAAGSDNTYYHYEAETPGFSYFAISAQKMQVAAASQPVVMEPVSEPEVQKAESISSEEIVEVMPPDSKPPKKVAPYRLFAVLLLSLILIWVVGSTIHAARRVPFAKHDQTVEIQKDELKAGVSGKQPSKEQILSAEELGKKTELPVKGQSESDELVAPTYPQEKK